jgi:hypothetical protein
MNEPTKSEPISAKMSPRPRDTHQVIVETLVEDLASAKWVTAEARSIVGV